MTLPVPTVAKRNPGRDVPVPESTWSLLPVHHLSGRAETPQAERCSKPTCPGRTGKPEHRSLQDRSLQHKPRTQRAMKPRPWLRPHRCPGTGVTRTDVTAETAGPRSSQAVSSFLINSFQVTYAPTSVSLPYLPLRPCAPRASRSQRTQRLSRS